MFLVVRKLKGGFCKNFPDGIKPLYGYVFHRGAFLQGLGVDYNVTFLEVKAVDCFFEAVPGDFVTLVT